MDMMDLTSSRTNQALELMVKFAGARQRVISSNIANMDTPNYQPADLSPALFQKSLRTAIDRRRASGERDGPHSLLASVGAASSGGKGGQELRVGRSGEAHFTPTTASGNILFHDRNDRDIERLMQANAENVAVFRVAVDLLRGRYEVMKVAISERV